MKKRFIWGLLMIVLSLILIFLSFFISWALIYGIPLFVIGLVIILNKNEDKIEQINYKRRKK